MARQIKKKTPKVPKTTKLPNITLNSKAICYGKKFGHDFRIAGNKCSRCGIGQSEPGEGLRKIEYFVKKPEHGMHSEMHALAKEISEYCGEPKKFGMYLGVIKNMGLSRAYKIFAELKQSKNIETPGKLFVYLSSYKKPRRVAAVGAKRPDDKHLS